MTDAPTDAQFRWIESTSWELPFFGLPSRIPWPIEVPEEAANRTPFEMEHMLDAIDKMGDQPGEPWASFRDASEVLDDLAEALEDSEVARATELIEKFEEGFPGTAFVLYHLGMVARLEGREDDALKHYQDAAAKTSRVPALWNNVGILLATRGQRDEAVEAFKKVLEIHPRDATALESLAQLRAIVKVVRDPSKPQEASYIDIPTYRQALAGQLNQVGNNGEELLKHGEQLLRDGIAPDMGFKALQRAAELLPDNPRALMALANGFSLGGEKEKARETIVRFTELFPEDPRGFFSLAQINSELKDEDAEEAALQRVLELDPNAQPALAIFFDLTPNEHDPKKEEALTEFSGEHQSWMGFIMASDLARRRGDAASAMKWAEKAYEVNPDAEEAVLQYTSTIGDARDFAKLASVIKPRLEEGKFSKRLDWAYAHVLHALGLPKDATTVLRKAVAEPGAPEEFKAQASNVLDAWAGVLTGCGVPVEIHQTGFVIRPVLLSLEDGDGGVLVAAGTPLPAEATFPWRATTADVRVALQQGQSNTKVEPRPLGNFVIREIEPGAEGRTTITGHVVIQRDGAIHFRATQDGRKLRVGWMPPTGGR